jgi:hypothetical protein
VTFAVRLGARRALCASRRAHNVDDRRRWARDRTSARHTTTALAPDQTHRTRAPERAGRHTASRADRRVGSGDLSHNARLKTLRRSVTERRERDTLRHLEGTRHRPGGRRPPRPPRRGDRRAGRDRGGWRSPARSLQRLTSRSMCSSVIVRGALGGRSSCKPSNRHRRTPGVRERLDQCILLLITGL